MTRSNARELALHLIYATDCGGMSADEALSTRLDADYFALLSSEDELYQERPKGKLKRYVEQVVRGVAEHREALDAEIDALSKNWSLSRISSLAKAILELAMYEALYLDDVPMNVAIHEAVVLAKKYEEADTVKYVNGVLGAFSRAHSGEKSEC
jgi:N utilization substance protein B